MPPLQAEQHFELAEVVLGAIHASHLPQLPTLLLSAVCAWIKGADRLGASDLGIHRSGAAAPDDHLPDRHCAGAAVCRGSLHAASTAARDHRSSITTPYSRLSRRRVPANVQTEFPDAPAPGAVR